VLLPISSNYGLQWSWELWLALSTASSAKLWSDLKVREKMSQIERHKNGTFL
jgi:hypothetical protein